MTTWNIDKKQTMNENKSKTNIQKNWTIDQSQTNVKQKTLEKIKEYQKVSNFRTVNK